MTAQSPSQGGPRATRVPALILVRHGRTALNAEGLLRGHLDPPLDELGLKQIARLATRLVGLRPARILSSPLQRATQTAAAIAEHAGLPVSLDARLLDRDYGEWAGHPTEEVVHRWGSLDHAPGVEPMRHVAARARSVLHEHVAQAPVVLVTHEAILRAMLLDIDPAWSATPLDPASWIAIGQASNGDMTVISANNS